MQRAGNRKPLIEPNSGRATPARRYAVGSGLEAGVQRDLGVEQPRDRAAGLGVVGSRVELVLRRARDLGHQVERRLGDSEARVLLLHRDRAGDLEALRGEAGVAELARERHREAAGVRRRDQLLGVRALAALEAGAERVLGLVEDAAVGGDESLPVLETALPDRGRLALDH